MCLVGAMIRADNLQPITHGVTKESKVIPGIGVTLKMPTGMPQKDETVSTSENLLRFLEY